MATKKQPQQEVLTAEATTMPPMADAAPAGTVLAKLGEAMPVVELPTMQTQVSADVKAELDFIQRMLTNPKTDIKKLRELLAMRSEARAHEAKMAYNRAMRLVQIEIEPVARDTWNDQNKSFYAKVETVDAAIRPFYLKHGFCINFDTERVGTDVRVWATVMHDDGHTERHQMQGALDMTGIKGTQNKTGPQGLVSATTIYRRTLTCMVFNVLFKDLDNDAQGKIRDKAKQKDAFAARNDKEQRREERNQPATPQNDGVGFAIVAGPNSKRVKTLPSAFTYLRDLLKETTGKQARIDLLLDNNHILKALDAVAEKSKVAELHKIANEEA